MSMIRQEAKAAGSPEGPSVVVARSCSIETMPSSRRTVTDIRLPAVRMAARIAMGGLLTAVAGCVDAIGYIGLT
jgi:hypothetical protein